MNIRIVYYSPSNKTLCLNSSLVGGCNQFIMSYQIPIRKRNRISLACNACKKRKIRCDKGKPCSSCRKHNTENICTYDSNWLPSNQISSKKTNNLIDNIPVAIINDNSVLRKLDPLTKTDPQSQLHDHYQKKDNSSLSSPVKTEYAFDQLILEKKNEVPPDVLKQMESLISSQRSEIETLKKKLREAELISVQQDPGIGPGNLTDYDVKDFAYDMCVKYVSPKSPSIISIGATKTNVRNQSGQFIRREENVHNPDFPGHVPGPLPKTKKFAFETLASPELKSVSVPSSGLATGYMIGINPYDSDAETINFYENSSTTNLHGPFSWQALSRKDPWLNILRQFIELQKTQTELEALNISSFHDDTPSTMNSSNFNYSGISSSGEQISFKKDSDANQSIDASSMESVESINNITTPLTENNDESLSDSTFARKALTDQLSDYLPYSVHLQDDKRMGLLNKNLMTLSLTLFDDQVNRELKLIEQLQIMLPKRKVIWTLLRRFFERIYPHCPFLDEADYRLNLERIIGPECFDDIEVDSMNVENRLDLAYLGILLVCLRLTYISLFSNRVTLNDERLTTSDISHKAQKLKYLLLNPIKPNSIEVAHICLHQFQLLKKINLPILQCALYLKHYHQLAPEGGEGVDSNEYQVYHGMLVQMAYSLGLHREPEKVNAGFKQDERKNHLNRRIWHYLTLSDSMQSQTFGKSSAINPRSYDTKPPFINAGNENLFDKELDREITRCYRFNDGAVKGPLRDLLKLVLNVNADVKLSEFTKFFNHFELATSEIFGRLIDYILPLEIDNASYITTKTIKCQFSLSIRCFKLLVYFYLFSHYEKQGNEALNFFYLKKILILIVEEMVPCFLPFIHRSEVCFGEGSDIHLNPHIIESIYRTNDLIMIIIVRGNSYIYKAKNSPCHYEKLQTDLEYRKLYENNLELMALMEKCAKICLMSASMLSHRYYLAWCLRKEQKYLFDIVTNADFYAANKEVFFNPINLNSSEVSDLVAITRNSLNYLDEILKKNCSQIDIDSLIDQDYQFSNGNKQNENLPPFKEAYTRNDKDSQAAQELEEHEKMQQINIDRGVSQKHHHRQEAESGSRIDLSNDQLSYNDQKDPSPVDFKPFSLQQSLSETPTWENLGIEASILPTDFENIPDLNSEGNLIHTGNDFSLADFSEIDSLWEQMVSQKNSRRDKNHRVHKKNTESSNNYISSNTLRKSKHNTKKSMGDNVSGLLTSDQLDSFASKHPSFMSGTKNYRNRWSPLDEGLGDFGEFPDLPLDEVLSNHAGQF